MSAEIGFKVKLDDLSVAYGDYSAKQTDVYANGRMQACVFPSVTYEGDDTVTDDFLRKFMIKNVKIYYIDFDGNKKPLKWVFKETSNKYEHDIHRSVRSSPPGDQDKSLSVPYYFTVPIGSVGTHRWVAGFNDHYTNEVEVISHPFSLQASDLNFAEVASYTEKVFIKEYLLALRYGGSFPPTQKLYKFYQYDGPIKSFDPARGKYKWFHLSNELKLVEIVHLDDYTAANGRDAIFSQIGEDISTAFSIGVAVFKFLVPANSIVSNMYTDNLKLEDNMGNCFRVEILQDETGKTSFRNPQVTFP
jgi:hypothetical protein